MKILLDGSDIIAGNRAIRRYAFNMTRAFSAGAYPGTFHVFINCFRKDTSAVDAVVRSSRNFSKIHCRIPRRITLPFWRNAGFPPVNAFGRRADIFHALGDDCPPVKTRNYIVTLHGVVYISRPDLIDPSYVSKKKRWLSRMAAESDYFIAVSETTKREFLDNFPSVQENRVKAIPLGVGGEFRKIAGTRVKKYLAGRFHITKPYLLYAGGIQPRKNIRGIIEAFFSIAGQFCDLQLVLVGADSGGKRYVDSLTRNLKLKTRIKVFGICPQESDDLPMLYNGAECFVFPSFSEGWTSPPLESMACGTPVVTSNVSSLPETTGDAAFMVDPDRPGEIGGAIAEILTDADLRNKLVEKGLKRAARYTWKRCAEETYRFYEKITNN